MDQKKLDLKTILNLLQTTEGFTAENDLEISTALSENYDSTESELFQICCLLVSEPEYEGSLSYEVAAILLEEYINPDNHLSILISLIKLNLLQKVETPFWHMLARSSYRLSEDFKTAIQAIMHRSPSFFAEVIERSQIQDLLPLLEAKIREVVPVVKFLPLTNVSHEHLWEHDFWLRGGFAYYRLVNLSQTTPHGPREYLEEVFLRPFPDLETWKATCSDEEIDLLNARIEVYNNIPESDE